MSFQEELKPERKPEEKVPATRLLPSIVKLTRREIDEEGTALSIPLKIGRSEDISEFRKDSEASSSADTRGGKAW
jgi:hypothetical protein